MKKGKGGLRCGLYYMQRTEIWAGGALLCVIGILILTLGWLHYSAILMEFIEIIYKNSVRTTQETRHVSVTKLSRFYCSGKQGLFTESTIRNTDTRCSMELVRASVLSDMYLNGRPL
jgi:hypothetical protein